MPRSRIRRGRNYPAPLRRIRRGGIHPALAAFLLLLASCERPHPLAGRVTIHRDAWGIPHVVGETDAAAVFGFAYAQAEDHFRQLEDNFIRASGRLAEIEGDRALASDRLNRALEIPRLAREEHARLDDTIRALVDAYADGVNFYLARHPAVRPRLLPRVEPWHPLAFIRYNYYQQGFALGALRRAGLRQPAPGELVEAEGAGSNGWVIAPALSATGHALLFINPHLPWFGPGQVYEGHVQSGEGWNFTGYTRFGFPFPYVGHNEHLGWVSTDNAADLADLYLETFDHPDDSLAYRYAGDWRRAEQWVDTIRVRTAAGAEHRVFTFRKTHHGPIVAESAGRPVAIRLAKLDADGWLREWYRMTRATNLREFQDAMRPLEMQFGNAMYADRAGHLFYVYNGAVPRRDPAFDWSRPVDGSDPATEWLGFHGFDELPQLADPASGWMQNCNGTPFLLTDVGNPEPSRYPPYMVVEDDNPRSQMARRILAGSDDWTLDRMAGAAFDRGVLMADSTLPVWLRAVRNGPDSRREALDTLRGWDHRSDTASVAMTLFVSWAERVGRGTTVAAALDSVLASLQSVFGTWRVPWGEMSRLQRWDPLAGEGASDDRPSLPLPGMDSWLGGIFTTWPVPVEGLRRRYSVGGGSYVSVVEFGPSVQGYAVHTFGASGDPGSPHYTDQAPLFATGRMRPVWLTREDVQANSQRSYRPGG